MKEISAGIGLNTNGDDSIFAKIKDKVKLENNGFSFVFLEKVRSIYLGAPQLFFAAGGKLEAFNNDGSVTGKGVLDWRLKVKDL